MDATASTGMAGIRSWILILFLVLTFAITWGLVGFYIYPPERGLAQPILQRHVAPFFFGNIALAVIVTPLFNASKGSILLPMLFHYLLINPLWPDAQPYDIYDFVTVAAIITWLNRDTMLTREGAVTEVIPGAERMAR